MDRISNRLLMFFKFKQNNPLLLLLFLGVSFAFTEPDYMEWSPKRMLSFSDFKGSVPAHVSSNSAVNLATVLTYEIKQEAGKPPQVKIRNLVDRNSSWMKNKNEEILALQQIKFDRTELSARKIRKKMEEMRKQGIKDKQKYIDIVTEMSNESARDMQRNNVLMDEQIHLIELMKTSIQDSLKLYSAYAD